MHNYVDASIDWHKCRLQCRLLLRTCMSGVICSSHVCTDANIDTAQITNKCSGKNDPLKHYFSFFEGSKGGTFKFYCIFVHGAPPPMQPCTNCARCPVLLGVLGLWTLKFSHQVLHLLVIWALCKPVRLGAWVAVSQRQGLGAAVEIELIKACMHTELQLQSHRLCISEASFFDHCRGILIQT